MIELKSESGRTYYVEYVTATRTLRIEYEAPKSGGPRPAYECLATAEEYTRLLESKSKGKYINAIFKPRLVKAGERLAKAEERLEEPKTTTGVAISDAVQSNPAGFATSYAPAAARMLQTYEADGCCADAISTALATGKLDSAESFECPKCYCEYRPTMIAGVRHWQYHVDVAMIPV